MCTEANKIEDLEARIKHLEEIHPDISMTAPGFIHGVITNIPILIVSIVTAIGVSILVASYNNKSLNKTI